MIAPRYPYIVFCFQPVIGNKQIIFVERFIVNDFSSFYISIDR